LIDEDMEKITKEWSEEFLIPVVDVELSDTDIIGSHLVTQVKHDGQSSVKKKKKKEEVHNIETDEEDRSFEENVSGLLEVGDEENGQGGGDKGENQGEGKATPSKDPPTETETPQKRKVSPQKPLARKKTCTSKPHLEATLMEDDISLVRRAMEDASDDIFQRYGAKQEELYERVEKELKET
jgi:hypothetical protein